MDVQRWSGKVSERAVRNLPVADGNGAFGSIGLEGTYPANESVVLPAFISGGLFMWDDTWESFGTFAWVAVG